LFAVIGSSVDAELFEYLGDVRREEALGDVVGVGDLLAGMPELGCGGLDVGLLVDEGGDGLAERVWGDPFEVGFGAGLAPVGAEIMVSGVLSRWYVTCQPRRVDRR